MKTSNISNAPTLGANSSPERVGDRGRSRSVDGSNGPPTTSDKPIKGEGATRQRSASPSKKDSARIDSFMQALADCEADDAATMRPALASLREQDFAPAIDRLASVLGAHPESAGALDKGRAASFLGLLSGSPRAAAAHRQAAADAVDSVKGHAADERHTYMMLALLGVARSELHEQSVPYDNFMKKIAARAPNDRLWSQAIEQQAAQWGIEDNDPEVADWFGKIPPEIGSRLADEYGFKP